MEEAARPKTSLNLGKLVRPAIGVLVVVFVVWRLWLVLFVERAYGPETWVRFAISGVVLGAVYEAFNGMGLLNRSIPWSVISIVIAFIVGTLVGVGVAVALERIAYRPLRTAPRLVPLISAIGASLFLENAAQQVFGAMRHAYTNPEVIARNAGWTVMVAGEEVDHLHRCSYYRGVDPVDDRAAHTGAAHQDGQGHARRGRG